MPRRKTPKQPQPPPVVAEIRAQIETALNTKDDEGRVVSNQKYGIYAFYDYDGEPIYVGQTRERLRTRIRRHLTNQRTDAVAMNVLDPFEVAEIEMWPFFELGERKVDYEIKMLLARAEYTVYMKLVNASAFHAILNEKDVPVVEPVDLPPSTKVSIIPEAMFEERKHPDTRIARRASTIAALARVISERQVSAGLRRTLRTQAQRLEKLADERFVEFASQVPVEKLGEETGDNSDP